MQHALSPPRPAALRRSLGRFVAAVEYDRVQRTSVAGTLTDEGRGVRSVAARAGAVAPRETPFGPPTSLEPDAQAAA